MDERGEGKGVAAVPSASPLCPASFLLVFDDRAPPRPGLSAWRGHRGRHAALGHPHGGPATWRAGQADQGCLPGYPRPVRPAHTQGTVVRGTRRHHGHLRPPEPAVPPRCLADPGGYWLYGHVLG